MENLLKQEQYEVAGKIIYKEIKKFEESRSYELMKEGRAYYKQHNIEILKREKNMNFRGKMVKDPYEANNKIPSGYMKKLVKQKIGYSINESFVLSTENKSLDLERIKKDLGRSFVRDLKKYATEASITKRASWYTYAVDGLFKYKLIKSTELILHFNEIDELDYAIRFWCIDDEYFADLYTPASISRWKKSESDEAYEIIGEPEPNMVRKIQANGMIIEQQAEAWNQVPFTISYNNDDKSTDLEPIKASIDMYDIVNSDFANNLDDFQDIYWVLKNAQGQDIDDFLEQLRIHKVLKTGQDGDARPETIDIPVEARKTMLELTEDNIYKFGMGVNTDKLSGSNITNVVIKARFEDLNLKANEFEPEMADGIYQLLTLLNRHYEIMGQPTFDPYDIRIKFDRSMIINEIELAELANESRGAVSETTRLANDPRVSNVDKEIEMMEEENPINLGGEGNGSND